MSERWAKEEELELWEIKQFYDRQLTLAKQQKQLEMKKKMEEYKILNQTKVNGGNISINAARTSISKFSPLNRNLNTSNAATATINTTFQTNNQTVKIPTTAKPTQLFIRGSQVILIEKFENILLIFFRLHDDIAL